MLQLVYVSFADPAWNGDLHALCDQARANNARDEITGILLVHHGSFLQVLEGPMAHVENTFIRIVTDPRHHALALLSRRVLVGREFGEWAMMGLEDERARHEAIARVGRIVAAGNAAALPEFYRHFPAVDTQA